MDENKKTADEVIEPNATDDVSDADTPIEEQPDYETKLNALNSEIDTLKDIITQLQDFKTTTSKSLDQVKHQINLVSTKKPEPKPNDKPNLNHLFKEAIKKTFS